MTSGRPLLVGVDVGTTLTKAGLVDLGGRELSVAAVPTAWTNAPTGAESSATELADGALGAIRSLLASGPEGDIVGVGVTGMAETVAVLDERGRPVAPMIAWHDTRATAEMAELNDSFGAELVSRVTGLGTWQVPTLPVLRWLRSHVPATRAAVTVLSVGEWVARSLGGDVAAEASLASRSGCLDIGSRSWWEDGLEWAGMPAATWPDVRQAGSSWGPVRTSDPGLARLAGATLTVAGHDHPCALVGIGIVGTGQVMDSCGTAEAIARAVPVTPDRDFGAGVPDGITVGWHVLPDHYVLQGGRLLGLDLISELARLGGTGSHGVTTLDASALALLETGSGPEGDGSPGSAWLTACRRHAAGAGDLLDTLAVMGGPIEEVRFCGGWSYNPVLRALKTAGWPRPRYPAVEEAGIRGAALLAGLAAGVYPDADAFPPPVLCRD